LWFGDGIASSDAIGCGLVMVSDSITLSDTIALETDGIASSDAIGCGLVMVSDSITWSDTIAYRFGEKNLNLRNFERKIVSA